MRILLTIIAVIASQVIFSQQTYYVTQTGNGNKDGKSWENASNNLSETLDNAQSGDAIWVASGTYQGGFFMKDGVSVYGGFAGNETQLNERKMPGTNENLTILDGEDSYRVLTQNNDFTNTSVWDGFVIQNGSSQTGGGVYLRKNGIIRRCIIKNNNTALPAVGDYIVQEGGVVFQVNKEDKKVWLIAEDDCGRNYHIYHGGSTNINTIENAILDMDGKVNTALLTKSRAAQAIQAYRGGGKSGWYIPSAGEWAAFLKLEADGSFEKTKTYELVEASLLANGKTPLSGKKYWSSTSAEHNGMASAWYINFQNEDIQKVNIWQYNRIRGIKYYTANSEDGKGGAVFAIEGSRIENCLISENGASLGSAICARGNVVLLNNTIVNNKLESSENNSSAVDGNSVVKIYNTIIAGNLTASGEADKYSGAPHFANSAVETSFIASGESNILLKNVSEVGFVDISSKDYNITTSSSLSEAGNIAYIPQDLDSDLSGKTRISGEKVSIGAYQQNYVSSNNENLLSEISIYPSPVKAGEFVYFSLNSDDKDMLVEIYDITGKKIISEKKLQGKIQAPKSAGTYILKLTLETKTSYEYKLIVN